MLSKPGIYLREKLYVCTMNWVDASTICRCLRRLGLSYQKIKHFSMNRCEVKRAKFWAEMAGYDSNMIVWVDETGCESRNALRKYGYGIRGMPPTRFCTEIEGSGIHL